MFSIEIAGLKINIDNKFSFVEAQCSDYFCSPDGADFTVSATNEEIERERIASDSEFSDGYLESVCIYRAIAKKLPSYNAFVMHSAVIEYENKAYCFAAKSGTGKTTHILLWQRAFGEKVRIINGDKPIMRFINEKLFAFGTPWSGKEDLGENICAQVNGICFLEQAEQNSISELSSHLSLNKLLKQIYFPSDAQEASITLDMIEKIISRVRIWQLGCNVSEDAARLACNKMHLGN